MMAMASTTASAAQLLCSPRSIKSAINNNPYSSSLISHPKSPRLRLASVCSQLSLNPFSQWSGLKNSGVSFRPKCSKLEKRGRCKKGLVVYASLFGVGAPEALVIGVVALLVFGPKGLAEVARNLGKTLRAFQPTIRELQEVSRDFKSTLEKEIGLDDISSSTISTYNPNKTSTLASSSTASSGDSKTTTDPNGSPSSDRAYTTEEYLKITEEQLKASAAQNQGQTSTSVESQSPPEAPPQATVKEPAIEEIAARTPSPEQSHGESYS